jgi:hypothetical protein
LTERLWSFRGREPEGALRRDYGGEMELREELEHTIRLAGEVMNAFSVALFWVRKGKIGLMYHYTLSRNFIEEFTIPLEESGIIALAVKNKEFMLYDRFDQEPYPVPYYSKDEDIKAMVLLPNILNGSMILVADSKEKYFFNEKEQKIFKQFGVSIEYLLKRAKLTKEGKVALRKYQMLLDMLTKQFSPLPLTMDELDQAFSKVLKSWNVDWGILVESSLSTAPTPVIVAGIAKSKVANMEGLINWLSKQNRLVIKDDGGGLPFPNETHLVFEKGSFAVVPIRGKAGKRLVLMLVSREPRFFDESIGDLANALVKLCEGVLGSIRANEALMLEMKSSSLVALENLEDELAKSLQESWKEGESILFVVCKIKDLPQLDKRHGIVAGNRFVAEIGKFLSEYEEGVKVWPVRAKGFLMMKTGLEPDMVNSYLNTVKRATDGFQSKWKGKVLTAAIDVDGFTYPIEVRSVEEIVVKVTKAFTSSPKLFSFR